MELRRLRVMINGLVQGVGFRPFVFHLARQLQLSGFVRNSAQGVVVEVEGALPVLETFLLRLEADRPPLAALHSVENVLLDPCGYANFEIRASAGGGIPQALVLPDIAICSQCLREIQDPADRRYRYPFTNCTHCGPRFSIVAALPYDRARTTMRGFPLCAACQREYDDPNDRRFHAQPTACPHCGPQLALWDDQGLVLEEGDAALRSAVEELRAGGIIALKGLGGFQLLVDARCQAGTQRLRTAKSREEKPFALMYPQVSQVRRVCRLSPLEERVLRSPAAPIVLLERHSGDHGLAAGVAPGNPCLGIMLPYTPLHHLLLADLGAPVVATSGNRADEPICTDEYEALARLGGIATRFLVHDRPIQRHVDDSVVRVMGGRELVLRRARGYAPLPVPLTHPGPTVVAVGAHLKSAAALCVGPRAFVGQHVGDLESPQAVAALRASTADLQSLYDVSAVAVAADMHPDYASTALAVELADSGRRCIQVQHHHAHVVACMAENELDGEVLGIAWDGTGYGPDHTIWGGEFLLAGAAAYRRLAHWRTFPLPGGEAAVREPRRAALGMLYELLGEDLWRLPQCAPAQAFTAAQRSVLAQMLRRGVHTPRTSSVGRLFDAVASLCGLRQCLRHEGQAAMELEYSVRQGEAEAYPVRLETVPGAPLCVDWGGMVRAVMADLAANVPVGVVAARFHNGLVEGLVQVAHRAAVPRVVLSGGCMQNRYLTQRAIQRLREEGFTPYWHQRIPPNDGGICLGQLMVARARLEAGISDHGEDERRR